MRMFPKIGASVAAASLALSVLASAALAALPDSPVDSAQDGKASITIVKYKKNKDNGSVIGNGTELTAAPGSAEPMAGAKFTLTKVQSVLVGGGKL
ncbi:hypothetical protein [Schaalia sp. lx-260]|uniref:hypothetical protein n=1 Tax=Schaalia sp. lx-260 TaxID=2899082 RepID=UPI001E464E3F|nr:hypothetical protein [Schaalia sp. lx-260]MCD4548921.1 hypothetical protein [Schaalia sp. lx-260]